jgi:hypothetical protein
MEAMSRVEVQTSVAKNIDLANKRAQYDNNAKALLSNKSILAWLLKGCVKEFAPFDVAVIEQCIEGNPEVATKALHKNEADVMLDGNESIIGDNTEENSMTETTITYDIRFRAVVPNTDEVVELIINVEAQTTVPLYPLEKRVIYYMSRLISSQYGTVFNHSQYDKIEKVYSIWICTGTPRKKQNTISGIALKPEVIYGQAEINQEAVDLMQAVIINVGDPEDKVDNLILKLMNTILSNSVDENEKKRVMQEDYRIKMTQKLESEVSEMCNLSKGIMDAGKAEGEVQGKKEMAINLHKQSVPVDVIANAAGVAVDVVKKWLGLETA